MFRAKPGLLLIRNPFISLKYHNYWANLCLGNYSKRPICTTNIDAFIPVSETNEIINNKQQLKQLRWSTLGYHYNWDSKTYAEDKKSNFPSELADLTSYVAEVVGYTDFKSVCSVTLKHFSVLQKYG